MKYVYIGICLLVSAIVLAIVAVELYLKISKNQHEQYREDLRVETDCAIRRKEAGLKDLSKSNLKESTRPTPNQPKRMLSAAIDAAALVAAKAVGSLLATSIAEWLKTKI